MRTNLKVSIIETRRKIRDDDDLRLLSKSIKDNGVKEPIIVDGSYIVIDGLRRVLAAVDAGLDEIPAIVVENYDDAIKAIADAYKGVEYENIQPRRIWEIQADLTPLLREKQNAIRSTPYKDRIGRQGKRHGSSRDALAEALNLPNSGILASLNMMYVGSQGNSQQAKYAQSLLDRIDSGELTPHAARGLWTKYREDMQAARRAPQQAQILSGVAGLLPGVLSSLKNLSSELDRNLKPDDLARWESVLSQAGTTIRRTVAKVRSTQKLQRGN